MSEQRAPLLSDEAINAIEQPLAGTEHERISARWGMRTARDFYESLIADGTLIRRDDLVVLMKAELENHYTALNYMDAILDHLNKKPA